MTLMPSKQKTVYRWQVGDLITPLTAAQLCGYRSAKQFQDPLRRAGMNYKFTVIWQGARIFFLRSEVDDYLTKKLEAAMGKKTK